MNLLVRMMVTLDLHHSANYPKKHIYEIKITKGPYKEIRRGFQGEILGVKEDDETETIFEASVGHGGSCSTCAYDYPDFKMSDYPSKLVKNVYDWEVKNFSIQMVAVEATPAS